MTDAEGYAQGLLLAFTLLPVAVVLFAPRSNGAVKGWLDCKPGTNVVPYVEPPKPEPVTRSCQTCSYREDGKRYDQFRRKIVPIDVCAAFHGKPSCRTARYFEGYCGPWAELYARRLCD